MKILLTNDDGIQSEGLCALASALKKAGHELVVIAPHENNSAVSHKINMRSALKAEPASFLEGVEAYSLSGTPADCVLVALYGLHIRPDLVLSGINDGINLGSDVIYSGTVAAALEGAQNGFPAIALSVPMGTRAVAAAEETVRNLARWTELAGEICGVLNINFPRAAAFEKGEMFCPCSKTDYRTSYSLTEEGYLMEFNPPEAAADGGDISYHRAGYITLTPLRLNMTDEEALRRWKK